MAFMDLFEEDDLFLRSRTLMPGRAIEIKISLVMAGPRTPTGLPVETSKTGSRRRTVGEALERATGAGSLIWKTGKQFPFTKPYAYALQGLTYTLIVVDPLDRLEGGLID